MTTPDVWIATRSGKRFTPLKPQTDQIELTDIAAALSKICRYTGQCDRFYSVAEHSVRTLWAAERVVKGIGGKDPADTARNRSNLLRWALLHDAAEAYLCDVAAPIKSAPQFALYRTLERGIEKTIAQRFKLPPAMPPEVTILDRLMLASEWPILMPKTQDPWGGKFPKPDLTLVENIGWTPATAEAHFLSAAGDLGIR